MRLRKEHMQYTTSERVISAYPGLDDRFLYDKFLEESTITTFKMMSLCNIFIKDVGTGENIKDDNVRRIHRLVATDKADDGAELRRACVNITNNAKDTLSTLSILKKINKASEKTYALQENLTDIAVEIVDIMSEENIKEIDTTTGLCADKFYNDATKAQEKKLKLAFSREGGLNETLSGLVKVVEELGNVTQGYKGRMGDWFDALGVNIDGCVGSDALDFAVYDTNGDGCVDKNEFIQVIVAAYPSIENLRTGSTARTFSTAYKVTAITAPIKSYYPTLHKAAVYTLKNVTDMHQPASAFYKYAVEK
eukprot:4274396-Ditylum_brightwellii.AAC.1